jgi:hypothetical protein
MESIDLESIISAVSLLSSAQSEFFSENCIVALEMSNHSSGCVLNLAGDKMGSLSVNWTKKVKKAGYKEEKKIIEHGAEAIAFLLTPKVTPFSVIEEATIGTGFDYWLGYDESHTNYDPKNFLCARLEVSGIKSETVTNTISQRVKTKEKQTARSANLKLPAYVSVTEFASPKSYYGKK